LAQFGPKLDKLFLNIRKNRRLRKEPCGTPFSTSRKSDERASKAFNTSEAFFLVLRSKEEEKKRLQK